jgi:hypothetical protein
MAVSVSAVCASASSFTCTDPYATTDGTLRLLTETKNEATEGIGVFTQAGLNPTSVYGFKITFSSDSDISAGVGGGCGFNSQSTGWKSMEWGNAGSGKQLEVASDNTLTYLSAAPCFKKTDTYCQIWIQCWWQNADATVVSIEPLDKSGKVIDIASAIADKEAADAAAAEAEAAEETTTAEVPAEETAATTEAAVTTTVEEEVEDAVDEDVEEDVDDFDFDFDDEDDYVEDEDEEDEVSAASDVDIQSICETYGTQISGEASSNNWGQAVKLQTEYHLDEGEVASDEAFDAANILTSDKAVVVFYDSETAPELILQSWSGGEGWAKVPVNELYSSDGVAVFTYDYMTAMYQSDDFSTVDCVYVGDTGTALDVYSAYVVSLDALEGNVGDDGADTADSDSDTNVSLPATTTTTTSTGSAASDSTTTAPRTGNAGAAAIASVLAVAGAAAVVVRKRK